MKKKEAMVERGKKMISHLTDGSHNATLDETTFHPSWEGKQTVLIP
jgi:transcriptional regulator of NAD metabolism